MNDAIPDFGDFVLIEQKRYRGNNEFYLYKVVGNLMSNTYRSVPVDARDPKQKMGPVVPIIQAICCGVDETKVERFRVSDVTLSRTHKSGKAA